MPFKGSTEMMNFSFFQMENQTSESQVLPALEQLSTVEVKPSYDIKQRLRKILAENRID